MPDIFISHSTKDRTVAHQVQQYFTANGADAFLAPFSIGPGTKWSAEILNNLQKSRVVLFLASREACSSAYVNQEIGGSVVLNKKIVPVVWDMPPEELPGWVNGFQAVDLRAGLSNLKPVLDTIVNDLKLDKNREGLILIGIIGFLAWAFSKKN